MSQGRKHRACPSDETLALFSSGSLSAADVSRLRAHVDGCDDCRALLAELGRGPSAKVRAGDVLLGKYQVETVLGGGGMGTVLRARHLELGRLVAIKVMHGELLAHDDAARRFTREARAAALLKSPHAVRILDIDRLPVGVPLIVMEHLDGRDLASVVAEDGPLPIPLAFDYTLQAAEALAEAHAHGIIHRDLKPHNVFLTKDGIVKVVDFGLAKALPTSSLRSLESTSQTKTNALVGSPHYMSPEQIRAGDVDARTDVWGLGATLHHLLCGAPPFLAPNMYLLCARILAEEAPSIARKRPDVPASLERVVARCLAKAADDRYASMEQLSEALLRAREDRAAAELVMTERMPLRSGVDSVATVREVEVPTVTAKTQSEPDTDRTSTSEAPSTDENP